MFKNELGEAAGITAKLHVSDNTKPYFCKARPMLHALRNKIELELQCLLDQKVIEPVQMSGWAAHIVPILKLDELIRICGDYKFTINRAAKPNVYPTVPLPGEMIFLIDTLDNSPVTATQIKTWTNNDNDTVLLKVRDLVLQG